MNTTIYNLIKGMSAKEQREFFAEQAEGVDIERIEIDNELTEEEENDVENGIFRYSEIISDRIEEACQALEEDGYELIVSDNTETTLYFTDLGKALEDIVDGVPVREIAAFLGATKIVSYEGQDDDYNFYYYAK